MDIIQNRKGKRICKINQIKNIIKAAKEKELKIDYHKLVIEIMSKLCVSNRTAQEYLQIALYELNINKEDL